MVDVRLVLTGTMEQVKIDELKDNNLYIPNKIEIPQSVDLLKECQFSSAKSGEEVNSILNASSPNLPTQQDAYNEEVLDSSFKNVKAMTVEPQQTDGQGFGSVTAFPEGNVYPGMGSEWSSSVKEIDIIEPEPLEVEPKLPLEIEEQLKDEIEKEIATESTEDEDEDEDIEREEKFDENTEIKVNSFNQAEITEINNYITVNVPYSILQEFFPLTDVPIEKAKIFVGMFRMVNSAKNYLKNELTETKLTILLKEVEHIYYKLYPDVVRYGNTPMHIGAHKRLHEIISVMTDINNIPKLNKFIDIFLVFAEKQIVREMDKSSGIDLDTPEGQKVEDDMFRDEQSIHSGQI